MRAAPICVSLALLLASFSAAADARKDPRTERLWRAKCAGCHGDDGKAQTDQGKKAAVRDLSTAAWQKEFTDEKIKKAIADGVNETRGGVKKEMEAYKSKLRPDQVDAITAYIRTLAK